jgi:hypothetical protein
MTLDRVIGRDGVGMGLIGDAVWATSALDHHAAGITGHIGV